MAADPIKYLAEWAETYARYKATFAGKIQDVKRSKNEVRVVVKDEVEKYVLMPFELDASAVEAACEGADRVFLVSFNIKEILEQLIREWEHFIPHRNLRIVMVNPFSRKDLRWVVNPSIHHKWTEPSALEKGLKSLFKTVDPLTKEKALKKIAKENKS